MGDGTLGMADPYGWDDDSDDNSNMQQGDFSTWFDIYERPHSVSEMSDNHIKACIRYCKMRHDAASMDDYRELWKEWVKEFEFELMFRPEKVYGKPTGNRGKNCEGKKKTKAIKEAIKKGLITSGSVQMKCHCGAIYKAKASDLKRGWALSCSKRCAAVRRDLRKPEAVVIHE